ncbi:MAG: hypothetical protein RLW61_17415 [Gammaproteobacteria bacterium]
MHEELRIFEHPRRQAGPARDRVGIRTQLGEQLACADQAAADEDRIFDAHDRDAICKVCVASSKV